LKKKKKTLAKLKKETQVIFNNYIRNRDTLMGQTFRCISCGEIFPVKEMNAGHYAPVKFYDWLRFYEDNCHSQCRRCNLYKRGNLIFYTWNLIKKIGSKRYNCLLLKMKNRKPYTREDIEKIKIKYGSNI